MLPLKRDRHISQGPPGSNIPFVRHCNSVLLNPTGLAVPVHGETCSPSERVPAGSAAAGHYKNVDADSICQFAP